MNTEIWCCACNRTVQARLTNGEEVYPHRKDLANLPFWKCDTCGNSVGCHHKTKNRTQPLGCIPTKELKEARRRIHKLLDPIWKKGIMSRPAIYKLLKEKLGWEYHTAQITNLEDAQKVCEILQSIR